MSFCVVDMILIFGGNESTCKLQRAYAESTSQL